MYKIFCITAIAFLTSCSNTSEKKESENKLLQEQKPMGPNDAPPSVEDLFLKMDNNKDEKLSKEEIEGPLQNDFDKVDTNKDGFISKEELNKAPKPDMPPPPPPMEEK